MSRLSIHVVLSDETRKILHEQECEKTLIALLTNEVVKLLNDCKVQKNHRIHVEKTINIYFVIHIKFEGKD